jgi:hypothetical protein
MLALLSDPFLGFAAATSACMGKMRKTLPSEGGDLWTGIQKEVFPPWLTERTDFKRFFTDTDIMPTITALRKPYSSRTIEDIITIEGTLRRVDVMRLLGAQKCNAMAKICVLKECCPGEVIVNQGDRSDFYMILKGKVSVSVEGIGTVKELSKLESWGELGTCPPSLPHPHPSSFLVVLLTYCLLSSIS